MPSFGKKSTQVRDTLHPLLAELCDRVVSYRDITLLRGYSGKDEQNALYAAGASTKQWPHSKHNRNPAEAIDASPWPIPEDWGNLSGQTLHAINLDWKERVKFYEMIAVFEFCWQQMLDAYPELRNQYRLRFGKDWDGDGDYRDQKFDDLPHVELIKINPKQEAPLWQKA